MDVMEKTVLEEEYIVSQLKSRGKEGHKGEFGHTFVVAGSFQYVGAPYFVAEAAVRSGSGRVTLFTRKEILEIMKIKLNEAMVRDIEDLEGSVQKADAVVFGSGMEDNEETYRFLISLEKIEVPLIIDADGLNVLKNIEKLKFLKRRRYPTIITPHLGEFARLTEKTMEEIKRDRVEIATEFARKYGVIVILKDSETVITDGEKIYINNTGDSSMSNGGMGDILAGFIGSLISQGYEPIVAGNLATYLLGKCGETVAKESYICNPRDILWTLPKVMKKTVQKKCFICYNIE